MSSRAIRLLRGWLVGVFATAIAALPHSVAGGEVPSALALGAGVVFGGMLGTFSLRVRPSLPRLAVAVGVTQLAFHAAFARLGTADGPGTGPGVDVRGAHAHDVALLAAPVPHPHADPSGMWLAHALAAVLTVVLLRRAEQAVWDIVVELARLVIAPFRAPVAARVPDPHGLRTEFPDPPRLAARHLTSTAPRRGPPVPTSP